MFFSRPGVYKPCGIFNIKHLIIAIITFSAIGIAVKKTKIKSKKDIKKIIKNLTILMCILEIVKTIYNFAVGEGSNINKMVPLYYCSILLYAGLLSSFGTGNFERSGNVFLATGGIIGGIVFIIFPTTSLPEYPWFHFISIHSFLFHGIMVYLGIIINKFKYIDLEMSDLKLYSTLIFAICMAAYAINLRFGSNLMFISQDFPNSPISAIYHVLGSSFTPLMIIAQMILPFFVVYGIVKNINNKKMVKALN